MFQTAEELKSQNEQLRNQIQELEENRDKYAEVGLLYTNRQFMPWMQLGLMSSTIFRKQVKMPRHHATVSGMVKKLPR